MLDVPADAIEQLGQLRAEPKFHPDPSGWYTGVKDPQERMNAEIAINDLIARVIGGVLENPTKAFVLDNFSVTLRQLQLHDTEDRERALGYLERIMECVGLESSDGLLNDWMYGFDPDQLQ